MNISGNAAHDGFARDSVRVFKAAGTPLMSTEIAGAIATASGLVLASRADRTSLTSTVLSALKLARGKGLVVERGDDKHVLRRSIRRQRLP